MVPDIVYVFRDRGPGRGSSHELFYSMRSLKHLPHGNVWVAGDKPHWVSRHVGHIPTEQQSTVWRDSTGSMLAACRHPDVSAQFVLFNDDYFVLRPITEVPVLHRGDVLERCPRAAGPTPRGARRYDRMEGTYKLCKAWGVDDPVLNYELHVPMPVDKPRMRESIEWAYGQDREIDGLRKRTLYGNMWRIGGDRSDDVTSADQEFTWEPDQVFRATSDRSFAEYGVGSALRRLFSEPSPYEREAA